MNPEWFPRKQCVGSHRIARLALLSLAIDEIAAPLLRRCSILAFLAAVRSQHGRDQKVAVGLHSNGSTSGNHDRARGASARRRRTERRISMQLHAQTPPAFAEAQTARPEVRGTPRARRGRALRRRCRAMRILAAQRCAEGLPLEEREGRVHDTMCCETMLHSRNRRAGGAARRGFSRCCRRWSQRQCDSENRARVEVVCALWACHLLAPPRLRLCRLGKTLRLSLSHSQTPLYCDVIVPRSR